jgi:hypothetical protein
VTLSAGSPAAARAWLIKASTCPAAALPCAPEVPPDAGEEAAEAGADARELAAPAAGAAGRGDGEPECGAAGDIPVPAGCARAAAWRGGTVTTAGGTTTVTPAGLAVQDAVPAVPQPAAMVRESTVAWPDAVPTENTPRAR